MLIIFTFHIKAGVFRIKKLLLYYKRKKKKLGNLLNLLTVTKRNLFRLLMSLGMKQKIEII